MGVRVLEGASKQEYYDIIGAENKRPYEQILKSSGTGPQLAPFYRSLFTGEAETAVSRNQNVDGSVTPVRFCLKPNPGEVLVMSRLIFIIRDGGGMDSGGWGNNGGSPLANGLRVGLSKGGVDTDFTPIPWKSHVDLGGVAYDLTYHNWGSGNTWLTMRLTIAKSGTLLRLDSATDDCFWMDVQDDLTYLVEQRCMCQGVIEGVYL